MKPALMLLGVLYLFLCLSRVLWPNPGGSLEKQTKDGMSKMISDCAGPSITATINKLIFPVAFLFYFPFLRPGAGCAIAVVLFGAALALPS